MSNNSQPKTIPELFFKRARASAHEEALFYKRQGQWRTICWQEYEQQVLALTCALADWIKPQDVVCILSENCPEWCFADLATLSLGGITAPIYPTNPPKDIAYILNDSGARLLFVSGREQLNKIQQLRSENKIPKLERVIIFDDVPTSENWLITLAQVYQRNPITTDSSESPPAVISDKSVATIIYTSGTTGEPKGVMLTHGNVVSNVLGAYSLLDRLDFGEKIMLSFLPLSHVFERTCGYYVSIHYGFKVAFAESPAKLLENMAEIKPTLLVSVPRIYEKLYAKVLDSASASPIKQKLLNWALEIGKRQATCRLAQKPIPKALQLQYALAYRLVFAKIQNRLGGRLKYAISGGAPLSNEVGEFVNAIGINVFEGYGMSETSPVIAVNRPGDFKLGSVGKPWPGVEIKIAQDAEREGDGEIMVRGPNVMQGYFNKPAETGEVLDPEGWFHTGDIGYFDSTGFLHLTDRKKELFKTAGGKYVAPQMIEMMLQTHQLIEQAVLIGNRRKCCVALIVPNFEALAKALGTSTIDSKALSHSLAARKLIQETVVDQVNAELGSWEQIKNFHLLPTELSQNTGELTPTLKIKRHVIEEKFKDIIDALYMSND